MDHLPTGDALADILKTIRLTANTYFCTGFATPWGMSVENRKNGTFHVVVEGECWLKRAGEEETLTLKKGDIVAFPTGGDHWISDSEGRGNENPLIPANDVVEQVMSGQNPFNAGPQVSTNVIMCGSFTFDTSTNHPFLKDLPCFIHVKAEDTPNLAWLRTLVTVMAEESRTASPGSTAMLDRLTEVLFIQLMRLHMLSNQNTNSYLTALADPQIGHALNQIHAETDGLCSVEQLADAAALSRTAFTDKFTKMVGTSPKAYLIQTRMQKAKQQLQLTNDSMIAIAENSGYSSEASFSKAFKQFFKITPGKVRRKSKT